MTGHLSEKNQCVAMQNEFVDTFSAIAAGVSGLLISNAIDPVSGVVTAPLFASTIKGMFGKSCTENIEEVLRLQGEKIAKMDKQVQDLIMGRLQTSKGKEFQYQVCWYGLNAFSDERRERVARLAVSGLCDEEDKVSIANHFLRILAQLSDEDIAILVRQADFENMEKEPNVHLTSFETELDRSRASLLASFGLLSQATGELGASFGRMTGTGREFLQYIYLDQKR